MAKGRNKFSSTLVKDRRANNHPAARAAKIKIRELVLEHVAKQKPAVVFDAYAGDGQMFKAVWKKAAAYVGCDLKWYRDEREAFVADNRRVLRAIDLQPFNIFDLDAWGSPWEQALIVVARRKLAKGELLGLVLTEGSGLAIKMNAWPLALRQLTGITKRVEGGNRAGGMLASRAIKGLCERLGASVVKRWGAEGKTGASVRYIGLVLVGG